MFFIYLAYDRKLDRSTCKKYYIELSSIFKYALKRGIIKTVPFDLVVFPIKGKDMSAKVISPEDLKKLLSLIKNNDPQLFLACLIQYYGFIRPGNELRHLRVEDIELNNGTIKVQSQYAKTRKERIVTAPDHLIQTCHEMKLDDEPSGNFIFGKKQKTGTIPVSINMLRWRFNKYRDKLCLSKDIKFYSLKHTGVSFLHNSKIVPLVDIMSQCGHTNLSATQHYIKKITGVINEELKHNFPSPI